MTDTKKRTMSTRARALSAFLAAILCVFGLHGTIGNGGVSASNFKRLDFAPPQSQAQTGAVPGRFLLAFDGTVTSQLRKEVGLPLAYVDILGGKLAMSPL
ncbi:MAG TPA: hypothetical protein PKM25_07840, partial [Candidatus Ozemobacteraceae bacterium]|nr:hypothetical protein [Candidatus Ozemobacteraceae bacterium]